LCWFCAADNKDSYGLAIPLPFRYVLHANGNLNLSSTTLIRTSESFIPFDLEAVWSSAVVLLVIGIIDPSLLKDKDPFLQPAYTILDEMTASGNLVAEFRRNELQQLDHNLARFALATSHPSFPDNHGIGISQDERAEFDIATQISSVESWVPEDGLSGEQLEALADSLNFNNLDWLPNYAFESI
jgi:proline utilization trans-activator